MILLSITSIIPKLPDPQLRGLLLLFEVLFPLTLAMKTSSSTTTSTTTLTAMMLISFGASFIEETGFPTKRNSSFLFFMVALSSQFSPILPLASALTASAFLATCTDGSINFENFMFLSLSKFVKPIIFFFSKYI